MAPTTKQITGAKNGGTRTIATKQSKYYPAEKVAVPKKCRKVAKAPRTSTKLVPGTIAILLSGPHRGKRVVVLKQMGALILVTGPYKVNGVPLRRVNRRYALATQTKIDVAKVDVAKFDDAYFKAEKDNKKKAGLVKTEDNTKMQSSSSRKADQKSVDTSILAALKSNVTLFKYLKTPFSLTNGQYPHELVF